MERNYTPKKAGLLACAVLAFAGCASQPKTNIESETAMLRLAAAAYLLIDATNYSGDNKELYEKMFKLADRDGNNFISEEEATKLLTITLEARVNNWKFAPLPELPYDEGLEN